MSDNFITKRLTILDGTNYGIWESQVMFYLQGKKLWKVVIEAPLKLKKDERETDEGYLKRVAECSEINEEARGRICSLVSSTYYEQLRQLESAAEVWSAIKWIGQNDSISNAMMLREQFTAAQLEEGGDILEHLGNLERFHRLLSTTSAPVYKRELIFKTIRSLPESWKAFVEGLRANKSLIGNYVELKKALINENAFRRAMGSNNRSHPRTAMLAGKNQRGKPNVTNVTCDNCGKKGHRKIDCWGKGGGKEGQCPKQRINRDVP